MQKKLFIRCRKQIFSLINIHIYIYFYTQNIWSFDHTKTKRRNNAHHRGSVLKDDNWHDLTEHESKFELADEGIESRKKK